MHRDFGWWWRSTKDSKTKNTENKQPTARCGPGKGTISMEWAKSNTPCRKKKNEDNQEEMVWTVKNIWRIKKYKPAPKEWEEDWKKSGTDNIHTRTQWVREFMRYISATYNVAAGFCCFFFLSLSFSLTHAYTLSLACSRCRSHNAVVVSSLATFVRFFHSIFSFDSNLYVLFFVLTFSNQ